MIVLTAKLNPVPGWPECQTELLRYRSTASIYLQEIVITIFYRIDNNLPIATVTRDGSYGQIEHRLIAVSASSKLTFMCHSDDDFSLGVAFFKISDSFSRFS